MNDKIKAKIDFLKLLFSFSMVAFFGIVGWLWMEYNQVAKINISFVIVLAICFMFFVVNIVIGSYIYKSINNKL